MENIRDRPSRERMSDYFPDLTCPLRFQDVPLETFGIVSRHRILDIPFPKLLPLEEYDHLPAESSSLGRRF